jgi:predicted O-methyltransferase YrrM
MTRNLSATRAASSQCTVFKRVALLLTFIFLAVVSYTGGLLEGSQIQSSKARTPMSDQIMVRFTRGRELETPNSKDDKSKIAVESIPAVKLEFPEEHVDFAKVMMPASEVSAILEILSEIRVRTGGRMNYLEFGSGGSTTEFTKFANAAVSIEHDGAWCSLVRQRLEQSNISHVAQRCVEKERVEHGGSEGDNISYRNYLDVVDEPGLPKTYDFVLIDGRARLGAALKVLPFLRNDSVLVLHDAIRKRYSPIRRYFLVVHGNMSSGSAARSQNGYLVLQKRLDINESLPLSHSRIANVYSTIPDIEA